MNSPKSEHTAAKIGCLATIAAAVITTAGAFLIAYLNRSPNSNRNTSPPITSGETNSNDLTNRNDSKIFIPAPTAGRPIVEPSKPATSDLGVWDFRLNFDRVVGKDGFIKNQAGVYDMVVRLQRNGNLLSGALLGSRYNNNMTWCDEGTITGTTQGNHVNLILQFADKVRCCPGEQWRFMGTIDPDVTVIEGSEDPVDLPTSSSCISLYSKFTAHRR